MDISDFDYHLPRELIAQYPLKRRDSARLLVLERGKKSIEHRIFTDIVRYIDKGELLVLNDTKVLTCRLKGHRLSGGAVELLLLEQKGALTFQTLIKPSRVKVGERLVFNKGSLSAVVSAKNEITFSCLDKESIYRLGTVPLPPYIKRQTQELDSVYYQTVYAKKEGAIASPTAGLHFTRSVLRRISLQGARVTYITLHISYSTFKPVKSNDITKHTMDNEFFEIEEEPARLIEEARKNKARIFAVGTTSCRALESFAQGNMGGYTNLFIYPGYSFKMTDCLLTNFHLPRTTLYMLVCAFAGGELIRRAYEEAIKKKYRFYSYGDAMLIL